MEDNLKTALKNVINGESAAYLSQDAPEFSEEFEHNMERILNGSAGTGGAVRKHGGMRVLMTAAACAAAVCGIGLTVGAAVTDGFTKGGAFSKVSAYDKYGQPTVKFSAAALVGAPETIEQTYAPSKLKDGINYKSSAYMNKDRDRYSVNYMQEMEDAVNEPFLTINAIQLVQEPKARFRKTFSVPKYVDVKEITVGGCQGFMVSQERYYGTLNVVIWDNGDYIFRLWCILPEADAIALAESVVPCDEISGEVL